MSEASGDYALDRDLDGVAAVRVEHDGAHLVTRREFLHLVERAGEQLDAAGTTDASPRRWLIACREPFGVAVACFAVWSRGGICVFAPNLRPETTRELAAREAALPVVTESSVELPDALVLSLEIRSTRKTPAFPAIARERTLAVLFTSGSTGTPQACPKTSEQLFGEATLQARLFFTGGHPAARSRRVLSTVPPLHIYGLLFGVLVPWFAGAAFVGGSAFHEVPLARLAVLSQATDLVSVPAHLRSLVALKSEVVDQVRRVFSSGAPLPLELARALVANSVELAELLGSSETGGIAYRTKPGATWCPLPGVSVQASKEPGEHGSRLLLRSPFLDASSPVPYLTGDRIRLVPNGFEHLGRVDGVLKIGAKRVSLQEIEAKARALPGVRDAVALAVAVAAPRNHEVWLVVAGESWTATSLRHALSSSFEDVALPRRYRVVNELPREENGKVTREKVLALFR